MGRSVQRLEKLIQRRVAMVLLRDLNDPRVRLVTVTRVELSRDRSQCKLHWSTLEEDGKRRATERALEDATSYVRHAVAQVLETRTTPELRFVFDKSVEGMSRVASAIQRGLAEDEERAREREDPVPSDPTGPETSDGPDERPA